MSLYLNQNEYELSSSFNADGIRTVVYAYEKKPVVFRKSKLHEKFDAELSAYRKALEAEGYTRKLSQMEKELAAMTPEEKIATAKQMAKK